jgi:hypothetical protein
MLMICTVKWDKYNLRVPTEPTPWPKDRLQRVSVNCFGVGGANAHASLGRLFSLCVLTNSMAGNYRFGKVLHHTKTGGARH